MYHLCIIIEKRTKIKKAKIEWRMKFGELSFDIEYRPRRNNVAADTFSCTYCASLSCQTSIQVELHEKLFHPGISRLTFCAVEKSSLFN